MAIVPGAVGCSDGEGGAASVKDDGVGSRPVTSPFSNEELQILGTHVSATISAEFTVDGRWIIVSGTDGVTIHDAASTECVHWLNGELIEVSPDGTSFLLGHTNGSTELRSVPRGDVIWRLPDDVAVRSMHFSDDGQYIVCGYRDLLRIETKDVVYRAPKGYHYDATNGGDQYQNAADSSQQADDDRDHGPSARLSVIPYIYRTTLRHDARPLITLKSGVCSPSGRFFIVATSEDESSYAPRYSFIDRKTGERLFSDVSSSDATFFHNDAFVLYDGRAYRTEGKELCYALAEGHTTFSLNSDETLLAVGWRNGEVSVLDPISGNEIFRVAAQGSRDVVSLAFSSDSERIAAVGRDLALIDVTSRSVADSLSLERVSSEAGGPEKTSPAEITFNADGSRLLLVGRQDRQYRYWRTEAQVFFAENLKQCRHLSSFDYFDSDRNIVPAYFSPDGSWAIAPDESREHRPGMLQLWDTEAAEPIADVAPQVFEWEYRRRFFVPEFPKRDLGLGRYYGWNADAIVMSPWSIDAIESANGTELPDGAKEWLGSFVHTNPEKTVWRVNGETLDLPTRHWQLRFSNNRIQRLYDLSTGASYPEDATEVTGQQARELDAIDVPQTCWGLASVEGIAFSPDGSHLLVYCRWRKGKSQSLLALFEMPSGKLVRRYEGHANVGNIAMAPNNRVAALSTNFYTKTWIIDLDGGETLVELPQGGMCAFSPDSRHAMVCDRAGECQSVLTIGTGDLIDFGWAHRWAFSPNGRYAVGETGRAGVFVDLATGEKKEIAGQVSRRSVPSTTALDLPRQGSRLICVDQRETRLFDVKTAQALATFEAMEIADERAMGRGKTPRTYEPAAGSRYLYGPNDRDFVYVVEGWGVEEESLDDESRSVSKSEAKEHSSQVLVGDLETGRRIECSAPSWSRSPLQCEVFTPDGDHLITISSDKMVCWRLRPPEVAWETTLSDRWTDRETGVPFAQDDTLGWSLGYAIHPSDRSILVAADGREAILFDLTTGKEQQRFGPLPINSVLRLGTDGTHLQVGFRADRSMRLYDVSSGALVKTYHFTDEGTRLRHFGVGVAR